MDPQHRDEALPEPTERDYREGVIIAVILGLVLVFELYLKPRLAGPLQERVEVCIILFASGLIHLLGSHLLAFLYNCRHFVLLHDLGVCRVRPCRSMPGPSVLYSCWRGLRAGLSEQAASRG